MGKVLSHLANAESIEDRGQSPWHLIVINHKGNFDGMNLLNRSAREEYLLENDEFAVINFTPELSMIAIRQESLEKCLSDKPMRTHLAGHQEIRQPSNVTRLNFNN